MYLLTATERLSLRHGLVAYQGHGSELVDLSTHAGVNMRGLSQTHVTPPTSFLVADSQYDLRPCPGDRRADH
jgi:hypothetical protein